MNLFGYKTDGGGGLPIDFPNSTAKRIQEAKKSQSFEGTHWTDVSLHIRKEIF